MEPGGFSFAFQWLMDIEEDDPSVQDRLEALGHLQEHLKLVEWDLVYLGRDAGMSWQDIATRLKRRKQSVWEFYGNR
jgi:hypothetical protein